MKLNIVNLIDTIAKVNYGVWNAALINATQLSDKGVVSYAVFPDQEEFSYPNVKTFRFVTTKDIFVFMEDNQLKPSNTLVVSHGSWRWQSKMGYALNNKGYAWMVVPQGMLEPWSMQQKKLKKKIYYALIEKRLLKKADCIRAVSQPEYHRLRGRFGDKVIHIPNGITPNTHFINKPITGPIRLLFMARLHHKKGIVPLLKGWLLSPLANNTNYQLDIAGPDDGELSKLEPLIAQSTNIHYHGAVYNEQKEALLLQSHVYILPSYSEGFPSSVLEAMDYGLFPLISEGCNFPEAFEHNLVLEVKPDATQIAEVLTTISEWPIATLIEKGLAPKAFVAQHYTNAIIGDQIYEVLREALEG